MCSNASHSSLLNLPRDECKRILRRLELEAYCSTVSALRAQGDLTNEKKLLLQSLQECLKISAERHGAEVRRAVNDQKLATVANNLSGPDVSSQWMREGRRLMPIMPRLVPHTAFTVTANQTAARQAEMNKTLKDSSVNSAPISYPSKSACKALAFKEGPLEEERANSSARPFAASSVDSSFNHHFVSNSSCLSSRHAQESVNGCFDSGITVMDGNESTSTTNKRKRENCDDQSMTFHDTSASLGVLTNAFAASSVVETNIHLMPVTSANYCSRPPIKLTVAKPVSRLAYPKQGGPAQKVIIVSGTGVSSASTVCAPPPNNSAQKSVVVSVMKTSASAPVPTVVTSFTVNSVAQNTGDATSANSFAGCTVSNVSQIMRSAPVPFERGVNASILSSPRMPYSTLRPRLKGLGTRPRTPQMLQAASLNHGVHSVNNISPSSLHMKPVPLKTTIKIQTENMKKIVAKSITTPSLSARILPKPVVSSVAAVSTSAAPTSDSPALSVTELSVSSVECRSSSGHVMSRPTMQSNIGNPLVLSESGSVGQNLLIVPKLSSALSASTVTSYSAFSNSPKQDRRSNFNFDIMKSRPTVVINRLHLDENAGREAAHSVVPSVRSEIRSVAQNSAALFSGSNPVTCSSNVASSLRQNCEIVGAAKTGTEEANVLDQENGSEDLSAITALLSLKMLPSSGMEQISPSSDDRDDKSTMSLKNDVAEKAVFPDNFITNQQAVILRAVEPTCEIDGVLPFMGSRCIFNFSADRNTINLPEKKDSVSDAILKESCEGQNLLCTVAPITCDPLISDSHTNGNCLNVSDVSVVQSSDDAVSCNSFTKDENSCNVCSPDGDTAVQLSGHHDRENPYTTEKDKITESLSPILGKRKRRPPRLASEPEPPPLPEWCRQALALLSKVMKYRSPHNERGKTNAASWFNSPVSAEEVPDYYDIVHQPMDFSTIKQNLRNGIYGDWSDFHSDMLLVRSNCYLYNAEDTDVRHDCDLVFEFYQQEYHKAVTFWKRQHHEQLSDFPFSSPSRRLKADHTASSDPTVH